MVPILLDFFDRTERTLELSVTFVECLFASNRYYGLPAQTALIVGNGRQNRIILERVQFINNDMLFNNTESSTHSFLVETSGPITVTSSCFENNAVGFAPIMGYGIETQIFVGNYVSNTNTTSGRCQLAAQFQTEGELLSGSPRCITTNGTMCLALGTSPPTVAPTAQPTAPTFYPTHFPSEFPSLVPTSSAAPTGSTDSPTMGPTTNIPSPLPTVRPSLSPSSIPTRLVPRSSAPVTQRSSSPMNEVNVTVETPSLSPVADNTPTVNAITDRNETVSSTSAADRVVVYSVLSRTLSISTLVMLLL
jgi:hypothetical protein